MVKREKLLPNLPYTNLVGVFSFAGDLGLKWKHNAFVSYSAGGFTGTFSQIYRDGYENQALPGSAARPGFNPRVRPYITYNASASQIVSERLTLTLGVKNVFNTDPPFAITYDSNLGAGSSWEPRVRRSTRTVVHLPRQRQVLSLAIGLALAAAVPAANPPAFRPVAAVRVAFDRRGETAVSATGLAISRAAAPPLPTIRSASPRSPSSSSRSR